MFRQYIFKSINKTPKRFQSQYVYKPKTLQGKTTNAPNPSFTKPVEKPQGKRVGPPIIAFEGPQILKQVASYLLISCSLTWLMIALPKTVQRWKNNINETSLA